MNAITTIIAAPSATSVTSMKTKAEREQFLADVLQALEPFGVKLGAKTPYAANHFVVDLETDDIHADFDFDGNDPNPSMIHWHRARAPLVPVPGAWADHGSHKATSYPTSFHELISALVAGFSAATDGSAFR